MESEFWLERWNNKEIGWHKDDFHPQLVSRANSIFPEGSSVFVPLCGKSRDMFWLAKNGYSVVGCELSEIAIIEFFNEINLQYSVVEDGPFKVYKSGPYTIYQGDFFNLEKEHIENCSGWYDRAALIALPESMRSDYVLKLLQLFDSGAKALIISLTYDEGFRQGPPFSVTPTEVENFFSGALQLEHLATSTTSLSGAPPAKETTEDSGNVKEHVFALTV